MIKLDFYIAVCCTLVNIQNVINGRSDDIAAVLICGYICFFIFTFCDYARMSFEIINMINVRQWFDVDDEFPIGRHQQFLDF